MLAKIKSADDALVMDVTPLNVLPPVATWLTPVVNFVAATVLLNVLPLNSRLPAVTVSGMEKTVPAKVALPVVTMASVDPTPEVAIVPVLNVAAPLIERFDDETVI